MDHTTEPPPAVRESIDNLLTLPRENRSADFTEIQTVGCEPVPHKKEMDYEFAVELHDRLSIHYNADQHRDRIWALIRRSLTDQLTFIKTIMINYLVSTYRVHHQWAANYHFTQSQPLTIIGIVMTQLGSSTGLDTNAKPLMTILCQEIGTKVPNTFDDGVLFSRACVRLHNGQDIRPDQSSAESASDIKEFIRP
jgi:hypothetical protein